LRLNADEFLSVLEDDVTELGFFSTSASTSTEKGSVETKTNAVYVANL